MKRSKLISLIFCTALVLLYSNISSYGVKVDFDGNGGFDVGGSSGVPMPSDPTPVYSQGSNAQSSTTTKTYSQPKSSSGSSLLTPQMTTDIVNSVYSQLQAQAKQKALMEQKMAEEKKKQEEALKKKDTQSWLKDNTADLAPKINSTDAKIKTLKEYDPPKPKLGGVYVPPPGETTDTLSKKINTVTSKDQTSQASSEKNVNNCSEFAKPAKSEGELREMYYNADREIIQCANGDKECSVEYVKTLQMKRLTAEQGLSIHYNYKEVNGQFIKKPQ